MEVEELAIPREAESKEGVIKVAEEAVEDTDGVNMAHYICRRSKKG